MRKERDILKVSQLETNNGQLGWLPKNPRQWTQTDIDRTKASIQEDTDFLEDRPLLVCPGLAGKYVVFGGNLRLTAARSLKLKEVPVVVYCLDEGGPEQDEIRETIKRRAMKDNGSFGAWDYDALANEWDDLPLADWGVPAWDPDEDKETPNVSPENFGDTFTLPDGEKEPFRQVSFQLSDEMAEILLLATKAAQFTDGFYEIAGDGEDVNTNGVAAYLIAKEWCDRNLHGFDDNGYEQAKKAVEELRQYLRASLEKSGKKAVDVDNLLGTNGMSGHYFGASQWMFPTRAAYEKMKEIMPLPRDYFECKKIEMRFNLLETLKDYRNGQG